MQNRNSEYDKEVIEFFKSPSRFHDCSMKTREISWQLYQHFQDEINARRSGKDPLSIQDLIPVLKLYKKFQNPIELVKRLNPK